MQSKTAILHISPIEVFINPIWEKNDA